MKKIIYYVVCIIYNAQVLFITPAINIFINTISHVINRDEFRNLFRELQNNSECDCIKEIKLAVHGKYDSNNKSAEIFFGTEWLLEPAIVDLFQDVKFCKNCKIIILLSQVLSFE